MIKDQSAWVGHGRVLSATRLHFPSGASSIPDATVQHLRNYAASTSELGVAAAIAVNSLEAEVERVIAEAAPGLQCVVLHVPVWGAFVPALNTLLGEAQRKGFRYILYQSLEVRCHHLVLKQLLSHLTSDTLVVGPVLEGHVFLEGEQPLNGRSSPWNTLALWSTRKLALTGFLHIADGMSQAAEAFTRQASGSIMEDPEVETPPPMGSSAWWNISRQETEPVLAVPAGVEEVTAIALLQHLLGSERARAVLLDLPSEFDSLVSWKTNWGQDERRKQWHEYKMASKVSRPAAQIHQLFKNRLGWWQLKLRAPLLPRRGAGSDCGSAGDEASPNLFFGTVHHYGRSIRPPWQIEWICLASFFLFSANFAAALSSAFGYLNGGDQTSAGEVAFVGLLLGGVYIPMPVSLFLSRLVVARADHLYSMVLFAGALVLAHSAVILCELNTVEASVRRAVFVTARFVVGLGSGILFQARFVLVSLSTEDHHLDLQARSFLASDLGLGTGALLPWVAASLAGSDELSRDRPDLASSTMIALLSFMLLVWILIRFPRRLHRLPTSVRFPDLAAEGRAPPSPKDRGTRRRVWVLLFSGTTRIFVQSAGVMTLALCMRDNGLTGFFRQTIAAAALCLLPVPCEALAASGSDSGRSRRFTRYVAVCTVLLVVLLFACSWLTEDSPPDRERGRRIALVAAEQALLLVALAFAVPLNVSHLYRAGDLEESLVVLEWLKAYVGRLLGPAFAIVLQNWLGYGPLLLALCCATIAVALTA